MVESKDSVVVVKRNFTAESEVFLRLGEKAGDESERSSANSKTQVSKNKTKRFAYGYITIEGGGGGVD